MVAHVLDFRIHSITIRGETIADAPAPGCVPGSCQVYHSGEPPPEHEVRRTVTMLSAGSAAEQLALDGDGWKAGLNFDHYQIAEVIAHWAPTMPELARLQLWGECSVEAKRILGRNEEAIAALVNWLGTHGSADGETAHRVIVAALTQMT